MSDIKSQNEKTAEKERQAYNRIMRAMMTLEEPSRMKVLGAVAIMVKPTVPIREEAKMVVGPPGDGSA